MKVFLSFNNTLCIQDIYPEECLELHGIGAQLEVVL